MEFSEKLVLLRRMRGMTQTDMADLLGVTRQSVYKWESGVSYPEAMTLLAMREVFGISLDALLDPAYEIRPARDPAPVITHVGEDFIPDASITVTKTEPIAPAPSPVEEEVPPAAPAPKIEEEAPPRRRGFFSRLFG